MSNEENIKSRVFGAVHAAQLRSAGTQKVEKKVKVVTHADQLDKVLENWSDPRNDRPAHTVANLIQAMNMSSGVQLTTDQVREAIPDSEIQGLMDFYMAWQNKTREVVLQFIVAPADKAKGLVTQKATEKVELTELQQLQISLAQAVVAKDKELQKEIMLRLAELS